MNQESSNEGKIEVLYGEGWYIEGDRKISGKIILGETKLYLKNIQGDLPQSFIALEKIVSLKKVKEGILINIRLSLNNSYQAAIIANRSNLRYLLEELVKRLGLKKKFLQSEWIK